MPPSRCAPTGADNSFDGTFGGLCRDSSSDLLTSGSPRTCDQKRSVTEISLEITRR